MKVYLKNLKKFLLKLEKISENQKKTKIKLDEILSNIPNIPHFDVPMVKMKMIMLKF